MRMVKMVLLLMMMMMKRASEATTTTTTTTTNAAAATTTTTALCNVVTVQDGQGIEGRYHRGGVERTGVVVETEGEEGYG